MTEQWHDLKDKKPDHEEIGDYFEIKFDDYDPHVFIVSGAQVCKRDRGIKCLTTEELSLGSGDPYKPVSTLYQSMGGDHMYTYKWRYLTESEAMMLLLREL